MLKKIFFPICLMAVTLSIFVFQAVAQEKPSDSNMKETKEKILKEIETLEMELESIKGCVERAKTGADLERCREEEKIRKYQEVQEMLFEMGMTREERRMKRLRQGELP